MFIQKQKGDRRLTSTLRSGAIAEDAYLTKQRVVLLPIIAVFGLRSSKDRAFLCTGKLTGSSPGVGWWKEQARKMNDNDLNMSLALISKRLPAISDLTERETLFAAYRASHPPARTIIEKRDTAVVNWDSLSETLGYLELPERKAGAIS